MPKEKVQDKNKSCLKNSYLWKNWIGERELRKAKTLIFLFVGGSQEILNP